MDTILVTGALGQLGSELIMALRNKHGDGHVIATDIRDHAPDIPSGVIYEKLDVMNKAGLHNLVEAHQVNQIYHLAAILSAKGEKDPQAAWKLNMDSLLNILDIAREKALEKIFWPSSIAVFGPHTSSDAVPQYTVMDPTTVYGISKLAGERWCDYYYQKFGVDVRSIRYPGIISYKAEPGGGTTDYAVDIFFQAVKSGAYECFLSPDTRLPMMYIEDAIRGTIMLMEAESERISVRSGYNLGAMSFSPAELAKEIQKHLPEFRINYSPDFRQHIADSWPNDVDDSLARQDWHWQETCDMQNLVKKMLNGIRTPI